MHLKSDVWEIKRKRWQTRLASMQVKSAYLEIITHPKLLRMKANFWKAFKPFLMFNCHLIYKDTRLANSSKHTTVHVVFM